MRVEYLSGVARSRRRCQTSRCAAAEPEPATPEASRPQPLIHEDLVGCSDRAQRFQSDGLILHTYLQSPATESNNECVSLAAAGSISYLTVAPTTCPRELLRGRRAWTDCVLRIRSPKLVVRKPLGSNGTDWFGPVSPRSADAASCEIGLRCPISTFTRKVPASARGHPRGARSTRPV